MTRETRTYLTLARLFALLGLGAALVSACTGYWAPGGAAPWCKTARGTYDCTAARLERDSLRADSAKVDTTGGA